MTALLVIALGVVVCVALYYRDKVKTREWMDHERLLDDRRKWLAEKLVADERWSREFDRPSVEQWDELVKAQGQREAELILFETERLS